MVKIGRQKNRPNTLVSPAPVGWRTLAEKVYYTKIYNVKNADSIMLVIAPDPGYNSWIQWGNGIHVFLWHMIRIRVYSVISKVTSLPDNQWKQPPHECNKLSGQFSLAKIILFIGPSQHMFSLIKEC